MLLFRKWSQHLRTALLRQGRSAAGNDGDTDANRRGLLGLTTIGIGGAFWSGAVTSPLRANTDLPDSAATPRIDIRTFGARGDRHHDDFDAIAGALRQAKRNAQYPASVFIPAGHFRRRASIPLPSHICIFGEGVSSVLNSQHDTGFHAPVLVNEDPNGLIAARLSDLALYGGSHGLRLNATDENADLRLTNVTMLLQSEANIEVNKLLQTVKIANCAFGDAPYGIKVTGAGTNCFVATASEWIRHSRSAIFLRGTDGLTVVGGRFEEGGRRGQYCIDIENGSNILFVGCFFENVHEYLARFRNIFGGVVFQSCHFSGTRLGGAELQAFRWDTADTTIVFRDCVSVQPMRVGGHVMLEGSNHGIIADDVLYHGNLQHGLVVVQPHMFPERGAMALIALRGGDAGWDIDGELTLLPVDSSSATRTVVALRLTDATTGSQPSRDGFALEVVRRSDGEHVLLVTTRDPTVRRLGWRFEWNVVGPASGPSVRAPVPA